MTPSTPSTPSTRRSGGRSAGASRALDLTVVLAIVLPLITGAAVLLTRTDTPAAQDRGPAASALGAASVVCPAAGSPVAVTTASGASGAAFAEGLGGRAGGGSGGSGGSGSGGSGRDEVEVALAPDAVGTVPGLADEPVVVRAEDDLAPGLVAGRVAERPLRVAECAAPAPEQWFTGVGAGAGHSSVLELVNPDNGPAVADVVVTGRAGVVDAPDLRGVAVPGRSSVRLDLADLVPRRDELSLHVTTQRGRVHSSVVDRIDELGAGAAAEDFLPPQPEPATSLTLLGLPAGPGSRTLVVANDGDSEVRVGLRVLDERSVFAPEGLEDVRVAPQSVARVQLGATLGPLVADGALGLVLDATGPVTATLRSFVGGDLAHAVPPGEVSSSTVAVVPEGRKRLVLGGATSTGVVEVVARDASGEELAAKRVEVSPDRGFAVGLPARAVHLTVTPRRTPVVGAVVAATGGSGVVRLRELVRSSLVPDVRPGLP
ncbi:hypothetical protein GGQ22_08240 [Nocardioides sp. zg-579]|uniref:Secreted protein n=1 Tax=Nocardioides marmotae TaxID=2663857 RepID=A0A6I3JAN8_9ACTN|nr:DUF5719 family protein [Nocardioides marmotae]MCR6031436.1 hypothetical protein [Gordonia jinghuaiqii]MTB95075.1 hypothetical protein [Nocardioides marmotae]QKE02429.1 hypothetical protein HPC71_16165 [Nocardioides marmotae]